jgi:hypothetical protein
LAHLTLPLDRESEWLSAGRFKQPLPHKERRHVPGTLGISTMLSFHNLQFVEKHTTAYESDGNKGIGGFCDSAVQCWASAAASRKERVSWMRVDGSLAKLGNEGIAWWVEELEKVAGGRKGSKE